MSKSLGNFFTIRDALARYHALALRWFLVATHYRAPVSYSLRGLDEARARPRPEARPARGGRGGLVQAAAPSCASGCSLMHCCRLAFHGMQCRADHGPPH